ncbi:hypothetical protein HDZ31DRAFT_7525, partial [Schizophyllum fasciatum]
MASTKTPAAVPTSSMFSFRAPYNPGSSTTPNSPATKTRRVSLALPSSPKEFPAWSFRDDTGVGAHRGQAGEEPSSTPEKRGKMRKLADGDAATEKKPRKRWTPEETQMLVEGCNRHGVGNWKAILSDPTLTFDNRSPVDLKDRFRTYFPDAYKKHYPNAKTHLSSKVRSTLPDGSSLFEKTRSKKRRPFTEEEDRALKAGYEKHGTVWATIVKDPVFQEQNRRSTDLRDRFRNAYPELYEAAGYKPRNATSRKRPQAGDPVRAATDDQLAMSSTGPTRRRRRAHTSQGFLRGGTKSVPQSNANSEDEASDDEDTVFKRPQTPVFSPPEAASTPSTSSVTVASPSAAEAPHVSEDEDMNLLGPDLLAEPDSLLNFLSVPDAPSQSWSATGTHTPTHSTPGWATTMGSPTSPDMSANLYASQSSDAFGGYGGMIGKSAWGTQDWFSPNPRMDPESSASTSSSYYDSSGISSFSSPVSHGVMDRLDLFPTALSHDFSSDIGFGETHSTFSDELFHPAGFRGYTHHSDTAGDLIFGARTHQSQNLGGALGLSDAPVPSAGIHPSQLHTPALANIDEVENIEISCMNLNDPVGATVDQPMTDVTMSQSAPAPTQQAAERLNLEDYVDLSAHEVHNSPPSTPVTRHRPLRTAAVDGSMSMHGRSISVPPGQARYTPMGRPPTAHANSQPEIGQRRMSFYDLASPPSLVGQPPYAAPPMAPSASLPVTMGPPAMPPPNAAPPAGAMGSPPPLAPFTGFASFADPYIQ